MLRRHASRAVRTLCALAALACAPPSPILVEPSPSQPSPLPEVRGPRPSDCRRIVSVEIRKGERRLEALCERGAVVTMTVALGREPAGPKRLRGDLKTPEGDYRVAGRARESRFYRFIPIDYPSALDADAGRADGRLSDRDYHRIMAAHRDGLLPPARTPLGGDIGFHGEGVRWRGESADLDWTYGCLAVTDEEMDFLAERLEPGTPVRILP